MILVVCFFYSKGQNITDTILINEISVIADKKIKEAGLNITKPDSLVMQSSVSVDLSELISGYTPIFIKSNGQGSSATVSFRGTAASHTQVLWNGMNINSPMRGNADISLIPVFFVDELYLLHGGSSMSEGSGALGGSIHINNKPDWKNAFQLSLMGETASFNTNKYYLKGKWGSGTVQLGTRFFYDRSDNDFPFYNYGILPHQTDTQKNVEYRKAGILQEIYIRPRPDQVISLNVWFQKSKRNLPQLMSYQGGEKEEWQEDNQLRTTFEWGKYMEDLNIHVFSGYNYTKLDYFRQNLDFDFVLDDSKSWEKSFYNKIELSKEKNENKYFRTSLDFIYHQVEIQNMVKNTGYNKNRFESSLKVEYHWKVSENLSTFFIVRSEYFDDKFIALIPSFGFELDRVSNWVLRSAFARNYHKPGLNDLYWLPGGNPDLEPEDGITGDMSLNHKFSNSFIQMDNEVTIYASEIKNWINWQPASNGAYYWEANNVHQVFSRGIEYQLNTIFDLNKLELQLNGNYSFTRTSNIDAVSSSDKSRGKQLIYIPKHKGNIHASFFYMDYSLIFSLNYTGKRYTTSSNEYSEYEQILNPYWISSMSLQKEFKINRLRISWKVKVDNLFDIDYQNILWRAMPGRNYSFSLGFNFM